MKKKLCLALTFIFFLAGAIKWLHYYQNGGFNLAKVTSLVPSVSEACLCENEQEIDHLLEQSFHFLGSGGTSFVFLGEDGKTVLKLFKHHHLSPAPPFFPRCFPGIYDSWRIKKIVKREKKHAHKRQHFFFNSCRIAHDVLKEETGLILLCLTPNIRFEKQIKLIDTWGISYHLNLSQAEFALQKKADLLFPYLEQLLKNGQIQEAKNAIHSLLKLIQRRLENGIADRDPNLWINFGFVDQKAIEFDLGSFFRNPALQNPFASARELFFSTHALQKWLETHSPELLDDLQQQLVQRSGFGTDRPHESR